jgi:signal transduction histidine kinase
MIEKIHGKILNFFTNLAERKRIFPMLLVLGVLPVILVTVYSCTKIYSSSTTLAIDNQKELANLSAAVLEERFSRLIDVGKSLASGITLQKFILENKWDDAVNLLQNAQKDFTYLDGISLVDPNGFLKANTPYLSGIVGKQYTYRDWYKGVSNKWEPYISEIFHRSAIPQYVIFIVAVPIKTAEEKILGILLLYIDIATLLKWGDQLIHGSNADLYFIDQNHNIIYSPNNRRLDENYVIPKDQTIYPHIGTNQDGIIYFNDHSANMIFTYHVLPKYKWIAVIKQSAPSVFAARNSNFLFFMFVSVIFTILSIIFIYLLYSIMKKLKDEKDKSTLLNAQLENSNKELESFSYSVSHDLRAPLRSIDGFSQALLEDYFDKLDAQGQNFLNRIRNSTLRMSQLIDDILNLSRVSRTKLCMHKLNLSEMCKEIFNELAQSNPDRSVKTIVDDNLEIEGDSGAVKIMLENLLGNAWKFTSKIENPVITVSKTIINGETILFVKDNGAGFDSTYVDRLFGAFQRLHKESEFTGTGIGLATVKRIVTRHGGKVWAEGSVNQGAIFYFKW